MLKILNNFKGKNICIVGDLMLDKYVFGDVKRISPEAPVQIVNVTNINYIPGGAGNVANNITSLSGNAFVVGLIGKDHNGELLIKHLKNRNVNIKGIICSSIRPTIVKERIIAHNQQLLRIDHENVDEIGKDNENKALEYLNKIIKDVEAVIISDYAKGFITKNLMENIKKLCKENNKLLIVDPRPQNKVYYKNVTLITPNYEEAMQMSNEKDLEKIGKKLVKNFNSDVLLTRGKYGMSLFEKNGKITHLPTYAQEIYDVSGAGDTVAATITLALVANADLVKAAKLANYAAGVVVRKLGTATTTVYEIMENIKRNNKQNKK